MYCLHDHANTYNKNIQIAYILFCLQYAGSCQILNYNKAQIFYIQYFIIYAVSSVII